MKTVHVRVQVPPERVVTLRLPDDVTPGEHRMVLVIDEHSAEGVPPERPALFNPEGLLSGLGVRLTLEEFQANRRDMWGTASDREVDARDSGTRAPSTSPEGPT